MDNPVLLRDNKGSITKVKNFCKCGCGSEIPEGSTWTKGHNIKLLHEYGTKASHWTGGRHRSGNGYIQKYSPDHKFKDKDGYVLEHRIIWEEHNKACLLKWAEIHHKNTIRHDNRIENLEATTEWNHRRYYHRNDFSDRLCFNCGNKTYVNYRGWRVWHRHPITGQEWLCRKCFRKIKYHMKR